MKILMTLKQEPGMKSHVLEGSKYWIVIMQMGDREIIFSVNTLGPGWNPYFINDGDNVKCFHYEGVHLQKGNML